VKSPVTPMVEIPGLPPGIKVPLSWTLLPAVIAPPALMTSPEADPSVALPNVDQPSVPPTLACDSSKSSPTDPTILTFPWALT
jgi:hypothetical protein